MIEEGDWGPSDSGGLSPARGEYGGFLGGRKNAPISVWPVVRRRWFMRTAFLIAGPLTWIHVLIRLVESVRKFEGSGGKRSRSAGDTAG